MVLSQQRQQQLHEQDQQQALSRRLMSKQNLLLFLNLQELLSLQVVKAVKELTGLGLKKQKN